MKRSFRRYIAWGILVASLSMLLFTMTAGPAHAWTQENNQFDTLGKAGAQCGDSDLRPCMYWKEPHNTSINVYFYMDPSLTSGGYDFPNAIYLAFIQYNAVPAWNPYLYQCTTSCPVSSLAGDYSMSYLSCTEYAETDYIGWSVPEYGYNPQRGGNEWYAFFLFNTVHIHFNSRFIWNDDQNWTGSCAAGNSYADGESVATHETGHAIGLGHTYDDPAIMNVESMTLDPLNHLSGNSDIPAIEAIYPGNQQSS